MDKSVKHLVLSPVAPVMQGSEVYSLLGPRAVLSSRLNGPYWIFLLKRTRSVLLSLDNCSRKH